MHQDSLQAKRDIYKARLDELLSQYYLNPFQKAMAIQFIEDKVGDPSNDQVKHVRAWLFDQINNRPSQPAPGQKGCPNIIPGLRAMPWWPHHEFPWLEQIQNKYSLILQELQSLRGQAGFQPYRGPSWTSKQELKASDGVGSKSHDQGDWNVYYLFLHDVKFQENCQKVPDTVSIIESLLPRQYKHAFFSAMSPDTHILKHHGPTNKKLRFHLPLIGVEGSRLRVDQETRELKAGQAYVFDDSFEHEAWHNGPNTRIILIADLWHPDLTQAEIGFFTFLQNAQMRYEKKISKETQDEDNFFHIIEKSKDLLQDQDWWVAQ